MAPVLLLIDEPSMLEMMPIIGPLSYGLKPFHIIADVGRFFVASGIVRSSVAVLMCVTPLLIFRWD